MKITKVYALLFPLFIFLTSPTWAESPANVIGVWTKTTSADYNNVAIFYQEGKQIKAIGYGKPTTQAVWWAEGEIVGDRISCAYQYSKDAVPDGWEPEGTFELSLSEDGKSMTGIAKSKQETWSGQIQFKKIALNLSLPRNLTSAPKN